MVLDVIVPSRWNIFHLVSSSAEELRYCYVYTLRRNQDSALRLLYCFFLFFFKGVGLFIFFYFWLCWVFVSVQGLSLVAASGGHSSSRCVGISPSRPILLWSTGSRRAGSVIVAHGPSCSAACGIFPDQGSNRCPLHWQADSQALHHQGSPALLFLDCSSLVSASTPFPD